MENIIFLVVGFVIGFGVLNIKSALKNLKENKKIKENFKKIEDSFEDTKGLRPEGFSESAFRDIEQLNVSTKKEMKYRLKKALEDEDYILVKEINDKLNLLKE